MEMKLFITVAHVDDQEEAIVSVDTTYGGLFNTLDALHGLIEVATPDGKIYSMDNEDILYDLMSDVDHWQSGFDMGMIDGVNQNKLAGFDLIGENEDRIVKVYVR